MPMVGNKKFAYTAQGEKDAKMEEKKTGNKMVKKVVKSKKKIVKKN